ncbi:MAG: hypothetical protein JO190_12100 [Candidatus Eremiobacteraeota bacterium]|nr:hypothetical protein [Candidatus Eremiobacteraeota bacterium]
MLRRAAAFLVALGSLAAPALSANAPATHMKALMEFCPASVWYRPAIPASSDGRSTGLVFGLFANSPRTIVSATVVADTDGGWYTWEVANVALTLRTTGDGESTRRVAVFEKPVFVRHAWILKARASGDTMYGWDAWGDVACGIPSFGRASYPPQTPQDPEGFPHVIAKPIAPLFGIDCPHPFQEATITHPRQPLFPRYVPRMSYTAEIEVAVGDADIPLRAWVYQSSGNRDIDANALAAARASSYQSATSYCQKADGYYLFRADFLPY